MCGRGGIPAIGGCTGGGGNIPEIRVGLSFNMLSISQDLSSFFIIYNLLIFVFLHCTLESGQFQYPHLIGL